MAAAGRFSARGGFLKKIALAALGGALAGTQPDSLYAQNSQPVADHAIEIAPVSVEIAPRKIIKTTGYNGRVPGPVLRLQEGKPVSINVVNESGYGNLIHWHGLHLPPEQDGAKEEGSKMIAPGQSLMYHFTPKPVGTRWYHSHAMAGTNLTRSTYSGEYGFLIVEPAAGVSGSYDREVLLAAHFWEGEWVSLQDLRKGLPPGNGLEVMYHAATLDDRILGHGEPIRVRKGERILFRLLNASATMETTLALPGHQFTVIALDGNKVPIPKAVDALRLDVAERADVIVEMNNPGVWILGAVDDGDRNMGLGVMIEYANRQGEQQWMPPPDVIINLKFEKIPGGRNNYNRWLINGKFWPLTNPLFTVDQGKRYRLAMDNNSGESHPVHLHRHIFEITKFGEVPTSGVRKDTISLPCFSKAGIDFVADDPGPAFFHFHHQDHRDEGFAGLITCV